jgi:hypothetical protein
MISQKINDLVTYALVTLLFAPHATKECVDTCKEIVFVSPTIQAFITPYMTMDISWHGFLVQLLWAPPLVLTIWFLFTLRDSVKYKAYFSIYALRWAIFFGVLVIYYNLFFWAGLRDYTLPTFIF